MRFLICLSLLIVGCGQNLPDPRTVSHDEVFDHYISLYKEEKGEDLYHEIPIGFADLKGNTVGLCTRWSSGHRQIQIDREYWYKVPEQFRISLIFHELGHCDLHRDHSPLTTSIMYHLNLGSLDFDELFSRWPQSAPIEKTNCVHDIEVQ